MKTITIEEKNYKVKFSFKAIQKLLIEFKTDLEHISSITENWLNFPTIIQIGINSVTGQNIELETIEMWLDAGDFERVKEIGSIVAEEITQYFKGQEKKKIQRL
jgi:hypothetical protein